MRFTDRVGKGIRTSPRDALIADSCAQKVRGKAFGLHRALDTVGAVLGPMLAFFLLFFLGVRDVFLLATIPAVLAVVVMVLFVREVKRMSAKLSFMRGLGSLNTGFRRYLTIVTLFSIANLSYGFLLLRAIELGFGAGQAILLYTAHNVAYVLVSFPAGALSDCVGR